MIINAQSTSFLVGVLLVAVILLALGGLAAWLYSASRKPVARKPEVGAKGELQELFRLHRERLSKKLVLETGGTFFRSHNELSVNQVDQLSILLGELVSWLGKPELTQRAVEAKPQASDSGELETIAATLRLPEEPAREHSVLGDPLGTLVNALEADVPKLTPEPKSIASQVDAILQARLKVAGMEERVVRLEELPGAGISVLVGSERYGSIDEIPDPEVRGLIRSAVTEWEKQTAG